MISIIDIGSNTVRMNVYQDKNVLFSVKDMAGLASQLESGFLLEKGVTTLIDLLNQFQATNQILGITQVYPFATASLRNIHNQQEVLSRIKRETGLNVEMISGEEEGRLGMIGALSSIYVPKAVLVDIGGGSCEVVPFENHKVIESISYPLGSLSMYKQFVHGILATNNESKNIKKHARNIVDGTTIQEHKFVTVVGIGGTIRALLKIKQYTLNTDDNRLTLSELKSMFNQLTDGSQESQDLLLKVVPDRIHTILPGLSVLLGVLQNIGCVEVLVSQQGVREGYLITHVLNQE